MTGHSQIYEFKELKTQHIDKLPKWIVKEDMNEDFLSNVVYLLVGFFFHWTDFFKRKPDKILRSVELNKTQKNKNQTLRIICKENRIK